MIFHNFQRGGLETKSTELKNPFSIYFKSLRKELTMGQVRPLVTVEDPAEQIRLAKMIKNMDLSARQAEMLAKRREETPKPKPAQKVNPELKKVEHRLQSYFGTKVKVSDNAIAISYKGYKDLNRILEILDLLDEE